MLLSEFRVAKSYIKNEVVFGVWESKGFASIFGASFRRPALCFCQKAALWYGCASCALTRGKADLRRTAGTALARKIRSLRGALDLGLLRRPSRPPAVEIPIHFVESDVPTVLQFLVRTAK